MRTPQVPALDFPDWSEAFAVCRERDRPLKVRVGNEVGTVYPSGFMRPSVLVCPPQTEEKGA